ncbi:uncharacterized protein MELLADRAFT_108844 [Melampsora larici-populina 98AG31]|uniref:Uncharacterized protein n=1 Tax=Melampsora larici-populina (strain 98AG31 / pathotype 3-4-7) TaxID=747676 RepID=F4RUG3_MELLP|nr:uncharacterized protein MELLADRAFT_108844 [Melampsora larici-populina 98AG31]EGG04002.1 hypothetical protein MELLADRAFT_108844 [Melampsora larici-populina 98AG31]
MLLVLGPPIGPNAFGPWPIAFGLVYIKCKSQYVLSDAGAEDDETKDPNVSKLVGGTKRRVVSNPKTSTNPKPPAKQPRTASTNSSSTIVLSSDNEVVITKVTQGSTKKDQKQIQQMKVLTLCPLSTAKIPASDARRFGWRVVVLDWQKLTGLLQLARTKLTISQKLLS